MAEFLRSREDTELHFLFLGLGVAEELSGGIGLIFLQAGGVFIMLDSKDAFRGPSLPGTWHVRGVDAI